MISAEDQYTRDIVYTTETDVATLYQLTLIQTSKQVRYCLTRREGQLMLVIGDSRFKPVSINFLEGKTHHRRQFGGGRGQLIAKAIGLRKLEKPTVLDLTAGMGQDAFVLACLGCRVTMLERSPTMAALLDDALRRLFLSDQSHDLQFKLMHKDARDYLQQLTSIPDIIYLDPMYPDSKNSAAPKKEMRVLRALVGDDLDAAQLFELALSKARCRVVIKRPRLGEQLVDRRPDVVFAGKSSRFDVYLTKS